MASNARQLLLLRHAKSAWDTAVANDFDRPLSKRGKRDAPRIGGWLRQQRLVPELVVSSPARRARKTTTKVCRELGVPKQEICWEPRIYGATADTLVQVLSECREDAAIVLLVGHNPGLENLLDYLCGPTIALPADGKLLPTATLARLRVAVSWKHLQPQCATLISITRPSSFPDTA